MVVAVAEESRGADHARPWIEQAKSSYWQLIDTEHRLEDLYNLVGAEAFARMYGLSIDPSPEPTVFVVEGDTVEFGNSRFEVLFTPGHSKGHVAFFHRKSRQVFSGDVLFHDSVGRVDLPGGSASVLIDSILNKLFPLGDEVVVHAGHMQSTTIGRERLHNPLVAQMMRAAAR